MDWRDRRQLLRELHLRLVVEVGARHVQELLRLLGDRFHDGRVRVPRGIDRDTGGAVQEQVAVHIFHGRPGSAGDDERIAARVRRRDDRLVAIDDGLGVRAGERGLEERDAHKLKTENSKLKREN